MDFEWMTDEQEEEISGRFSIPKREAGSKFISAILAKEKEKSESERTEKTEDDETKELETTADFDSDPITISMLGISGSGKTMFLSGVYQTLMQGSMNGFSLRGDDTRTSDNAWTVTGQISKIALNEQLKINGGWPFPLGTHGTIVYPLILKYLEQDVCELDFMDYAGGDLEKILKIPEDNLEKDQKQLLSQLRKSDELMIFAEADVIARHNVLNNRDALTRCRTEIGASRISQVLGKLGEHYQGRRMTVLIILTKIDAIPKKMRDNNYAQLVRCTKKVFEDLWNTMCLKSHDKENPWDIGIVPVTAIGCGNKVRRIKTMEERDGKTAVIEKDIVMNDPQPENMDAAMLYSIATILKQRIKNLQSERNSLIEQMNYGDEAERKANAERREVLGKEVEKLTYYSSKLSLGTGVLNKILERNKPN